MVVKEFQVSRAKLHCNYLLVSTYESKSSVEMLNLDRKKYKNKKKNKKNKKNQSKSRNSHKK
jgi:hypothetical protein